MGAYNSSQWAADLDNAANKKFVEAYEKEYGRPPSMYSAQGYDAAMLIDGAVRDVQGKIEDREAFRAAVTAANASSGYSAADAADNAEMQIEDYHASFTDKFKDYSSTGTLPGND